MPFAPPAFQADFTAEQRNAWDVLVSSWIDDEAAGVQPPAAQGLFYNPQKDSSAGSAATQDITWDAFPLLIREWFKDGPDPDTRRWIAADTPRPEGLFRSLANGTLGAPSEVVARQQDEYCEWFVESSASGIERVTFTAEGPEYWEFIASGTKPFFADGDPRQNLVKGDPDQLVELYRALLGTRAVAKQDLYWPTDVAVFSRGRWRVFARQGDYNRYNVWNTKKGAVHLTHRANTLRAEVNLAARATVIRADDQGGPVTNAAKLICCSGFGSRMRSSDPTIGSRVNSFARQGLSVTLANPVGLYISEFLAGGITGRNNEDMSVAWTVVRGRKDEHKILRAVFEVPTAMGFKVSDCTADGKPIRFGGQIADHIKMTLTGAAKKLNSGPLNPVPCDRHCCTHPQKPNISEVFVDDCASITQDVWDALAPFEPGGAGSTGLHTAMMTSEEPPAGTVVFPKTAEKYTRMG